LPAYVAPHVDFIIPGVTFSPPLEKHTAIGRYGHLDSLLRTRQSAADVFETDEDAARATTRQSDGLPSDLQNCGHRISPECLKAFYHLPSTEDVASSYNATPANSLGVFELGGTYNQDDMNLFFQRFSPNIPNNTHPVPAPINGAKIKQHSFVPNTNYETELDLQIAYPIIYPQTITQYQVSPKSQYLNQGDNFPLDLQDFLDAIDGSFCSVEAPNEGHDCGIYVPRKVISISYGASEVGNSFMIIISGVRC
jgi:tripeptidyl-peptidase I